MLKHKDHFHGSDLEKIEEIYHIQKEDITSFSANVNPLGISPLLRDTLSKHLDAITTYPDRNMLNSEKASAITRVLSLTILLWEMALRN